MKPRLIIGVIVAVLLMPQAALASCAEQPFDQVVRSSDAVLVATVAAVRSRVPGTGIIVRLDVQQILKGTAQDGRHVLISSCGKAIVGQEGDSWARSTIGTRGLFLLTRPDGLRLEYSAITTPQGMTLDQQIERAREVLAFSAAPGSRSTIAWWIWALIVALLVLGVITYIRRARRT